MTIQERIARAAEELAQRMDDAIPMGERGQAGKDYTFGIIKGLRDAAQIARETPDDDALSPLAREMIGGLEEFLGHLKSGGKVSDWKPGAKIDRETPGVEPEPFSIGDRVRDIQTGNEGTVGLRNGTHLYVEFDNRDRIWVGRRYLARIAGAAR